jgi:TfoX/Sxy family transcriptional regulator of competence genes
MARDSFHDFVKELFASLGPVQVKRMFGGAGGYADGVMFLLLADDAIYLKADDALKAELREEGCGPVRLGAAERTARRRKSRSWLLAVARQCDGRSRRGRHTGPQGARGGEGGKEAEEKRQG